MKISILGGAGLMGAGIVRDLVSDRAIVDISTIRICDTSRERMEGLVADLGDSRLELFDLNVTDPARLAEAIEGADLCINCVPTLLGFQMTIFEAALSAKVTYMDLGGLGTFTVKQIAEHERFKAAGVTAVVGVGADPGMSNVICRAVADELDTIEKINLYWAAELTGDENPILMPPYSVSTVLAEYAHPSTQFFGGKHVECAPMTGREVLDLPEPWGRCEFMYSPHSEQLTVPLADGIRDKGIQEVLT
jgi:saccharopine dehydrogenase-like NADP-dependent oxidoreductase